MFHLRAATASAIILALALAACGGDKKNADDASSFDGDQPADDNLMEQADSLGEEGGDSGDDGSGEVSSDGPTIEKKKKKKKAREQDYQLMYRDCKALAGTYGRAYENDELKKLEKQRFNEKQLANAQNNVKKAAREAVQPKRIAHSDFRRPGLPHQIPRRIA